MSETLPDARLAPLEELARRLEALLSVLEQEAPAPETLDRSWNEVALTFDALRSAIESAAGPWPEELVPRVERALKLHAVAANIVARQREVLAADLERLAGLRRQVRAQGRPDVTGRSCNVAG